MATAQAGEASASEIARTNEREPRSGAWKLDPLVSSLFLSGAALILAIEDPVNIRFEPRLVETLAAVIIGVGLLIWANLRHAYLPLFAGAAVLLTTTAAGITTQPTPVNAAVIAVWPLRAALILLMAGSWGFLLQPPQWVRRAMIAFAAPSLIILVLLGGPATAASLFGGSFVAPPSNHIAPFWLAVDSRGTLYATDLDGGLIWIFNSSGVPQGTLRPGLAPPVPTPGPGILPAGFENELTLPGMGLIPTPTVVRASDGSLPRYAIPSFDFCGMATDPQDNLYLIDFYDPSGYTILRFNRDGNITARWPAPSDFQPTNDCIAADAGHIYLNSVLNRIYVLNHDGKLLRQVPLPFQAFGISTTTHREPNTSGGQTLLVAGATALGHIDGDTGTVITSTLPVSGTQLQVPVLFTRNNEVLMVKHQDGKLVRLDANSGQVLGSIGGSGSWPGQFAEIGGLAEDNAGRIYVSDYRNRVIQRFEPDGKVDSVWWAQGASREAEFEGGGLH